jgi:hypothetical protein
MITSPAMDSRSDSDWNRQGQVTRALMRACSLGSSSHLSIG